MPKSERKGVQGREVVQRKMVVFAVHPRQNAMDANCVVHMDNNSVTYRQAHGPMRQLSFENAQVSAQGGSRERSCSKENGGFRSTSTAKRYGCKLRHRPIHCNQLFQKKTGKDSHRTLKTPKFQKKKKKKKHFRSSSTIA
jgi:hypothetical protein